MKLQNFWLVLPIAAFLKNAAIGRLFKIYTPGPMAVFFKNAAIGPL